MNIFTIELYLGILGVIASGAGIYATRVREPFFGFTLLVFVGIIFLAQAMGA